MATEIHKTIIAKASDDPLEYVMSDETVDRYGDVIKADGWDLRSFKKNPIALFGHNSNFPVGKWVDVGVRDGALRGRLELLPRGTSYRLDEIRAAVEAGVLRAVSVGFRPIDAEPKGDGVKYKKAELMECSLVSIPANPNALQIAKQLNLSPEAQETIFGVSASEIVRRDGPHGVPASKSQSNYQRNKSMNIAPQIEVAQQQVNAARDALADYSKAEEHDIEKIDELNDAVEAAERSLAVLQRTERNLALRSAEQAGAIPPAQNRLPAVPRKQQDKPENLFIKSMAAFAVATVKGKDPDEIAKAMYGDDERVGTVLKAAVSGATTTTSGWAAELVNTAMDAFIETLRPQSVYPALSAAGGGRLAFGPNQGAIKIPSRAATPSIGGSFVGEGAPIPVRRLGLQSITLSPKKMGVISVFSREIARYSTPAIESLIRQEIINDTAQTVDGLLLDAVAASSVRPGGLRAGVTALTPTAGGGYDAMLGDLRKLRAPFNAANAGRNLMLLVNSAQQEAFSMTPGPDGSLNWAQGILARYQVVSSTAIPEGRVIMLDAADFVSATGDVPEFELSESATLHMEDTAPEQIGSAPAGTDTGGDVAYPTQSMFQTAQISIRMLMDITWAMRRDGMVQYIDGATW